MLYPFTNLYFAVTFLYFNNSKKLYQKETLTQTLSSEFCKILRTFSYNTSGWLLLKLLLRTHCVKSVQIRSFFWSVFSCIWTDYGDLRSPNSVQTQENTDQKKLRICIPFTQWPRKFSPDLKTPYNLPRRCSTGF